MMGKTDAVKCLQLGRCQRPNFQFKICLINCLIFLRFVKENPFNPGRLLCKSTAICSSTLVPHFWALTFSESILPVLKYKSNCSRVGEPCSLVPAINNLLLQGAAKFQVIFIRFHNLNFTIYMPDTPKRRSLSAF